MVKTVQNYIFFLSQEYGKKIGVDLSYLIGNGFWVLFRQVSVALGGLFVYAIFARYAEQNTFGNYQFILTVLIILGITALPGMGAALVQASVRKNDGTYQEMFRLSLRSGFFGSLILLLAALYFLRTDVELGLVLVMAACIFPFLSPLSLWDGFLQGKERFDIIARYATVFALIQSVLLSVAIIFFHESLLVLMAVYFASAILLNWVFYRKSLRFVENSKSDQQSIDFGFFMTKIGALGIIAEQIDKILVGILLGPVNLAAYAILSFFGIKTKDAVRSFSSMLVPKLILGKMTFWQLILCHRRIVLAMGAGIFLLGITFFLFIDTLNLLVFTNRYSDYLWLSRFYVVTILLSVPLTIAGYYIYAKQNIYALTLSGTVFYVFRILLNVFCIYFYGLLGAIAAYNLSMIALLFIYWWGIYHEEHLTSSQR